MSGENEKTEYLDLGLMNSWTKTPEVVEKCRELCHKIRSIPDIYHSCYSTVVCDECKYYYEVDSSG